MSINKVTITGADESVHPKDLLELSAEFPFVEWGILVSSKEPRPRFPSAAWIDELGVLGKSHNIQLAGHICGNWTRNLVVHANDAVFQEHPEYIQYFPRIQLNFSPYDGNPLFLNILKPFDNEFIIQMGDIGNAEKIALLNLGRDMKLKLSVLFDRSGGRGIVPLKWPEPIYPFNPGYAGGLGPETLLDQLPKISEMIGDRSGWIDMESKVRSDDDQQFDLEKVRKCLEISRDWVK